MRLCAVRFSDISPRFWIVTLGTLPREKGLDVVEACARDAKDRDLPLWFRVLGATTRALPTWPGAPISVAGAYVDADLAQAWGWVNRSLPASQLWPFVVRLASRIAV